MFKFVGLLWLFWFLSSALSSSLAFGLFFLSHILFVVWLLLPAPNPFAIVLSRAIVTLNLSLSIQLNYVKILDMEITYFAHSCFEIKNDNLTLLIDPFDDKIGYKMPKIHADVLLLTHAHFDHANKAAVSGYRLLVDTPGEYEVSGVSILGLPTFHDSSEGSERGKNNVFVIEIDGINVMHLGDLGHELSKDTLDKLPEIDVLMIPVGGNYTIDAEVAGKVISSIEPGIVIPMHYKTSKLSADIQVDGVEKFLEEMGVETPKNSSKLKLSRKTDIPEETEVLVLNPTA